MKSEELEFESCNPTLAELFIYCLLGQEIKAGVEGGIVAPKKTSTNEEK